MIKKVKKILAERPRLRILVILIVVILAIVIGLRVFSSGEAAQQTVLPSSKIAVSNRAEYQNKAANVETERYKQLSEADKKSTIKHAASSGKSYFSDVFEHAKERVVKAASGDDSKQEKAPGQAESSDKTVHTKVSVTPTSPVSFYRQQHGGELPSHVLRSSGNVDNTSYVPAHSATGQPAVSIEAMKKQLDSLSTHWALPTQTVVAGAVHKASSDSVAEEQGNIQIKAGSIIFAVLDTALDSDQPGTPVLATIVTGKYKGARLLGSFRREQDRVVVSFSTMSLKNKPASISISAFAINAETAQTALASDVNHHYLLRYGSLFASAFLQGFGNAFQNIQPTCPPGTPCTVVGTPNQINVTTEQATYQGLGELGTRMGDQAEKIFDTPPTVKLYQGIGVGILFMSDVRF